MGFFALILARVQQNVITKGDFMMEKIADPMICATGKIYSLSGLRLLLQEIKKNDLSGGEKKEDE